MRKEGLDTTVSGNPYRFPSRDECMRCHGSNFNRALAFYPAQLNRDGQLERFFHLGMFDKEFVQMAKKQPLGNPYDESASVEQRARSWLHSNCSHCHRLSGGTSTTNQMNISAPNDQMALINTPPTKGRFGLENAPMIEPGNPYRSILYYRMATKGAGHMPMLGARTQDREGVRLVHDWIRALNPEVMTAEVSLTPKNAEEALALYQKIQSGALLPEERKRALAFCMKHTDPFVLNLFAGFSLE
ncbi:MAG: hypothetical protein O7C75_07320 [Verrucomicrobia bacterium]|nr:hypothetical protein [Verrucomicrobiota bacterium]